MGEGGWRVFRVGALWLNTSRTKATSSKNYRNGAAGFQLHVPLPLEPETPYADLVRLKFHSGPEAQILPTLLQKCFGQKPHVRTRPAKTNRKLAE